MKLKNQKGVSLIGMLLLMIVAVMVVALGLRIIPVFTEYRAISRVAKYAAEGVNEGDIRSRYDQQIRLEGVYDPSVTGKGLKIEMISSGAKVSFAYEREVGLFGPVYLLFKMDGSQSAKRY